MRYLICEKCGGYYLLQDGEYPDSFDLKCDCGGHLKYVKDEAENKKNISAHLFKISAALAILGILILATGIYNYENPGYGNNEKYSQNEINYFTEIGFASDERIHKWKSSVIRVKIIGSYTSDDSNSLNSAINDINHGASGFQMTLDSQNNSVEPDVEVYFIPRSQFNTYGMDLPESVGACEVWSDSEGNIQKAKIVIPSDPIYQEYRSRIIPHELGHSLGLMDSYENKGSILYYRLQDRSKYANIDKVMLRILYRDDILPGMSKNEVETILNRSRSSFGL